MARTYHFVVAIAALLAGGLACSRYVVFPWAVAALYAAWVLACYRWPRAWLFVIPAVLPVAGFASWTGWLIIEELDLLLAGALAGTSACAALARTSPAVARNQRRAPSAAGLSPVSGLLMFAFLGAGVISLARGLNAAEPVAHLLTQGYFDPLNSARVFKPFAWAVLFTPALIGLWRHDNAGATRTFQWGMVAGLAACSLAALWERLAFTGLVNFSSDYRTTALFWEMHVGGAALDGYLALATPFAVWAALHPPTRRAGFALAAAVVAISAYASLITFSRGVYLAVPVAIGVLVLLGPASDGTRSLAGKAGLVFRTLALAALAGAGSSLTFEHGGYRAMLAAWLAFAALIVCGPAARTLRPLASAAALVGGVLLAALTGAGAGSIPKGAYVVDGLAALAFGLAALAHRARPRTATAVALVACCGWLAGSCVTVAQAWGGPQALAGALPVALGIVVLALANAALPRALWSAQLRHQAVVIGGTGLVSICVAIFLGGAYMGGRFSTSSQDFGGRLTHWRDGIALLGGPADWLFGKGLGRFPAEYFYNLAPAERTGTYAWKQDADNAYLALAAPHYSITWGDMFRVAQRVPIQTGRYQVSFDVRGPAQVTVHVEVCEKQLLYDHACAVGDLAAPASPQQWHPMSVTMDGDKLTGGPWYAPRLGFFSIGLVTSGGRADIDNLRLIAPDGRQILVNGEFSDALSRWFFTSDRHHLPWHIKNIFMNLLFDQGIAGLVAFVALVLAALGRLCLGGARGHPMAPCLAASIVGFLVVGLFDSLLDVPRVSWIFYLIVMLGLVLRAPIAAPRPASGRIG